MTVGYIVELEVFAGPLDLLLHLIEKEELEITRVALARVTDQYLAYLERIPHRDLAEMSSFLVVAAQLLWIKSRALLPQSPVLEEEEDPGEDLMRQLEEFRRYKEAARQMQGWLEAGRRAFERLAPPPVPLARPAELENATLEALLTAIQQRLAELAAQERAHPLPLRRRITLAEKARQVRTLLRTRPLVHFADLLSQAPTREEVVVTLWTVLELFKRRWILFEQEELFGAIVIRERPDTTAAWDQQDEWWAELEDLD